MNHLYKCNNTNTMLYVSKMFNGNTFRFLINNAVDRQDIKLDNNQVNRIINWFNLNNTTCLGLLDEEINIVKIIHNNKYCLKFYNPYIQICLSGEEFKQLVDLLAVTDDDFYSHVLNRALV